MRGVVYFQEPGQCRIPQNVVDTLTSVFLALQASQSLRSPVTDFNFVDVVKNDSPIRHGVRGLANFLEDLAMQLLITRASLVLVIESGEHLLPDTFAISECVEIAGMQRPVKRQELPDLPDQGHERRAQKADQRRIIYPADQRACSKKDEQAYYKFPT